MIPLLDVRLRQKTQWSKSPHNTGSVSSLDSHRNCLDYVTSCILIACFFLVFPCQGASILHTHVYVQLLIHTWSCHSRGCPVQVNQCPVLCQHCSGGGANPRSTPLKIVAVSVHVSILNTCALYRYSWCSVKMFKTFKTFLKNNWKIPPLEFQINIYVTCHFSLNKQSK